METLSKRTLFWDVKDVDPQKDAKFIIERVLDLGDKEDVFWAINFYGKNKVKECFLQSKGLNKKSVSFWCNFFNINPSQCIPNQSIRKQSAFWQR